MSVKSSVVKVHPIKNDLDAYYLAEQFGPDTCLHRILHLAVRHNCKCVVQEDDVAVDDFDDEHKGFYAKLFRQIPAKTIRLHFFFKEFTKSNIAKTPKNELQKYYIGFCTLRPLKKQRIIEAFLPPLQDSKSFTKKAFHLCLMEKKIRLGEKELIVKKAFPFIQQDANFDCCAHVAMRSMNQFLSQKWDVKELRMENIVAFANSVPLAKRDAPTEGLSVDQIATVIKKMGFDVLVYEYKKDQKYEFPPERIVYHYIESGLPVLLGIPTRDSGHALVVTGHTFDPDEWWPDAEQGYFNLRHSGGCYHCSTTWVSEFIVNDDNFGPYMTIPKDYLSAYADNAYLIVMVPIPKEVNFKGEDAEIYAHAELRDKIYREALSRLPADSDSMKWARLFWEAYDNQKIVLRTFLLESEKIKKVYNAGDYPAKFKGLIKKTKMPQRVWVTEFSLPHLFSQHRKLLGQIVTDSTSTPSFGEPAYLTVHLPGQLLVRDENDAHECFLWRSDYPREHQFRK